jgi:hypothetical protein
MIGTIKISQLPPAEAITGNENLIVNQDGDTRLTTINDAVGIVTYVNASGISTVSQGLTGNPDISVSSLNVSGISTLGNIQVFSGIVTASSGIVTYYGDGSKLQNIISGVGIQSSGTAIGSGITTLNFIGAGNTFSINGSTVDISIQGGGGSQWVDGTLGISTSSYVGIGTTNPIQPLQVGVAGTNVFVVTDIGSVGIGTTNPSSKLQVAGDINLDDGGSFVTTLQTVTATANRTISFPNDTGTIALVAGSSGQVTFNLSGKNTGDSGLLYNDVSKSLTVGGATTTTSNPILNLSQTWNTVGTTYTGVLLNITNTNSAVASLLMDWQVGGASRFQYVRTGLSYYYNTTTSVTNYERAKFGWESNILRIGTEKLGTGVARDLELQTDGITRVTIGATTGNVGIRTTNPIQPFQVGTAGTSVVVVNLTGGVGIGSQSPTAKLDVLGGDIKVGINTSNGLVLTSPDGTRYRLFVENGGILSTVAI